MPLFLQYRGFDYVAYSYNAFESADSLPALKATGANSVGLNIEYGINALSSTVYSDAYRTENLTALGKAISEAVSLGLSVMVKPLIDFVSQPVSGIYSLWEWRSYYNPTNPSAFFASYKSMIVAEAQVAQANGASLLSIGTEIDQLTGPQYLSYWTDIISSVRAVYSGKLTYSADWQDEVSPWKGISGLAAGTGDLATQVSFWNQLDYVGIDQYAALSDVANPTLADLIAGWTQVPTDPDTKAVTGNQSLISYYESVAAKIGKPLVFTEIGYESASDAAKYPYGSSTNVYDPALQARLYQALFDAWNLAGNNSLTGVYFWDWDPNAAEVGPGHGPGFSPQGLPAQDVIKSIWLPRNDFNSDGYSDILWQNDSGQAAIWTMSGFNQTGGSPVGGNPGPAWHVVGSGDLFGDGTADILWQNDDGSTVVWKMNGLSQTDSSYIGGNAGPTWHVKATGDFNGDGKADILWQNDNGQAAIWEMNGYTVLAGNLIGGNPGTSWHIVGAGDFNGDGKADIVWQSDSGQAVIWTMDGLNQTGSYFVGGNPGPTWHIKGVGDFYGTGQADILWQNDAGQAVIWTMNGTTQVGSDFVGGNPGPTWHIVGTGDYNGDGKADILWQNDSGQAAIWTMNGVTQLGGSLIGGNPGTAWHIPTGVG